ncbi:zinc finger FYVE domain-containing protein 9 isoform X1 [Neodiprion pinetum]|uniref:zinc finger FYVE domain-containing protein 9 isoform X1 n=2 Tax=Neodiprion pinetum TaxID=441929 RepID=UPI001EE0048A|nr:zinc finger FYVE domain-containing protein 9 isoform X1 [Neodiprion pinetum]
MGTPEKSTIFHPLLSAAQNVTSTEENTMEKFAVDIDKVLDELEFNEDRAEQIASIPLPGNNVNVDRQSQCLPQRNHNQAAFETVIVPNVTPSESLDETADVHRSSDVKRYGEYDKNTRDLSIQKGFARYDSTDVGNNFYSQESSSADKIQHKQSVESYDSDAQTLTIHNDIAQKPLQKKQNDASGISSNSNNSNNSTKLKNSYDKKLNQPNAKPSVSNVFSSLNEYINASSAKVDNVDNIVIREDTGHKVRDGDSFQISDTTKDLNVVKDNCGNSSSYTSESRVESNIECRRDTVSSVRKISTVVPPEYQNILLPVKLETALSDARETNEVKLEENISLLPNLREIDKEPLYTNTTLPTVVDRPKESKSIIDRPEHVYENVYIGTDIPKPQELYTTVNKAKPKPPELKAQEEIKHTYENVDFDEPKKVGKTDGKENVYECIYIGNRENFPETTTEVEIAAKKITDQLHVSEKNSDTEAKGINLAKLVFQTVQLGTPETETKPVGFSHIDDLSEEELNKYLADLEAEERAQEATTSFENSVPSSYRDSDNLAKNKFQTMRDDEDANEAPIFESVTIGELPEVSSVELLEKAKKFPVIDYSKSGPSSEGTADFLVRKGSEKFSEHTKVISEAKEEKGKGRKSKRTNEKMRKTSDNSEPSAENIRTEDDDLKPVEVEEVSVVAVESPDKSLETHEIASGSEISQQAEESGMENDKSLPKSEQEYQIVDTNLNQNSKLTGKDEDAETETNQIISVPDMMTGTNLNNPNNAHASELSANNSSSIPNDVQQSSENNVQTRIDDIPTDVENCEVSPENNTDPVENDEGTERPTRPLTLDIVSTVNMDEQNVTGFPGVTPGRLERVNLDTERETETSPNASETSSLESGMVLGKQPPFWVPDSEAPFCMLCEAKFTVLKRRHHCRACGKVLCSKCCGMKYRLEYQGNIDSRVCLPCYQLLVRAEAEDGGGDLQSGYANFSGHDINSPNGRQPNPNNPMEYCSTIPPLQQLAGGLPSPPTVMVPVGVLKREGSTKQRPEGQKSVMFSDGIRPGCDLTELDSSWDPKPPYRKAGNKRLPTPPGPSSASTMAKRQNLPPLDPETNSYIPQDTNLLPPTVTIHKGQISYHDVLDQTRLYESLKNECEPPIMFAINRNLYAYVKITNLSCCVNRICWNITSRGLACVGQDEVIFLVETLPDETLIPKDLLIHINLIYVEAIKGNTITELGVSIHQGGNLLGSREHAGFIFIRQTFQCLQRIVLPPPPFLVGLLVHRWETPWAKVFPLRLMLRLGAEYRYYPCPLVSVRFRDAVYSEIGHTIMKVLADFRNFAYTLPGVRGLAIHMQDRTTDVMFPKNRYDQVIRGLNNSNDHVLAYASNFSINADSHLVCIQTNTGDESNYQTQAINIHNKPRRVTGASFVVINGALKSSMGLSAKSSIVEDGLMVQIMPEKMEALKAALKNMQDFSIGCGPQGATEPDETVNIKWVDNDMQFNVGVKSPIDSKPMDGVPSIRVHNGTDYMGTSRFIRWTEVFIIRSDDHPNGVHDPVDINRLSENIARATCAALVKLLDLLATAGLSKIAVRSTIHPDNVGYEAGSEGTRLPPIYMKSLDNELIQVLHKAAQSSQDTYTVLELIFHVLDD